MTNENFLKHGREYLMSRVLLQIQMVTTVSGLEI